MKCQLCKEDADLPFRCNYCGQYFCGKHRLPERHLCPNLPTRRWRQKPFISSPPHYNETRNIRRTPSRVSSNNQARRGNQNRVLVYLVIFVSITAFAMYMSQPGAEQTTIGEQTTSNETIGQDDVPVPTPPTKVYFSSLDELALFLDNDNISDIEWVEDVFMCGDFTQNLIDRADAAGYNTLQYRSMEGNELQSYSDVMATVSYTSPYGRTWRSLGLGLSGAGHAVCETTIGNKTVLIEPQNDMIFELSRGIFTVLYKGSITKYGQKLPEPDSRTYFKSLDDLILFFENDDFSKIIWNESMMVLDLDSDSSGWNEVMIGYYNGERFEWDYELLDAISVSAGEYGCNTLFNHIIREDELRAYSNAISTISYQSGSTIWSYGEIDLSSVDSTIVFKTTIGNNTMVIAPQTDIVFEYKDGEYIVQYKGEITKNEG